MIVLMPKFQSGSPKAELSDKQFRDKNTPLSILFANKFFSARQLKNRYD